MPNSQYVFESNVGIIYGQHGETSYLFHSSEPVENNSNEGFVFESGTQLNTDVRQDVTFSDEFNNGVIDEPFKVVDGSWTENNSVAYGNSESSTIRSTESVNSTGKWKWIIERKKELYGNNASIISYTDSKNGYRIRHRNKFTQASTQDSSYEVELLTPNGNDVDITTLSVGEKKEFIVRRFEDYSWEIYVDGSLAVSFTNSEETSSENAVVDLQSNAGSVEWDYFSYNTNPNA